MAVHAHRTPNLHPRPNRFGSATTAHKRGRKEPEVAHQYTLPIMLNQQQQQQCSKRGREEPEVAHQYTLPILLNQQQQQQQSSKRGREEPEVAHQYTLPILLNQQQQQQSSKRGREEPEVAHQYTLPILLNQQQQQQSRTHNKRGREESEVAHQYALPILLKQQQQQSRVYGSHGTSTSGRTTAAPAAGVQAAQQNLEIDAIVQLQTERMLFELELVQKRQCRDLISILGQQVMEKINEKDAEVTRARRRTMELEQKVREAASHSQIWFNVAKNNEEVVCNLQSAVDQALLQKAALAAHSTEHSDCGPADDAESCCYEDLDREPAVRQQMACRVCGEKEVCVLILPCRHLCLCKDCEPSHDSCPVCHTAKNGKLQIFLS